MADTIKIEKKNVLMVAHRGLSGIETENTNVAFTAAGQRTYFGIETDVHVTKDGKYIIIHDDATCRVSETNLIVEQSTFDELRAIKLKDREDGVTREDLILPTLDDYVKICRRYDKVCVLELKNYMEEKNIAEIIEIIKTRDYLEKVIFISFNLDNMKVIRKLLPEQPAMFLCGELDDGYINLLAELKLGVDIHYPTLLAHKDEYMPKFKAKGIEVNCWTVDNPADAKTLIDLGVDYITTNILE